MSGVRRVPVGELTRELAGLVGEAFDDIEVVGEVGGFKAHTSGHWYFTLKDADAVISCAMWRTSNQRMKRAPREGERLAARGAVEVYAARGTYSLVVRQLVAIGVGDLAKRLAELKARLESEGLFDPARKRRLPPYPRAVGIATSETGAALQDMLRVIRERHPTIPILVAPCRVQGEGAAEDVARAVRLLEADGRADVLIVGRGGGSAEDLFCFNEEPIVRAVAGCSVPIVSAVGHQTDWTLCDLAADLRAATPSHAGELAVPVLGEILATLHDRRERLEVAASGRVAVARDRLARTRLVHPRQRLDQGRMRLADLEDRLHAAIAGRAQRARQRLAAVRLVAPSARVQAARVRLDLAVARMPAALVRRRGDAGAAFGAAVARLEALSPLAVLTRGYAIAQVDGRVILDARTVPVGAALEVRVQTGRLRARVEGVDG
ncbi:MAG: hypothetical protein RLZZ299_2640 [Pseudomonadota bacterium]